MKHNNLTLCDKLAAAWAERDVAREGGDLCLSQIQQARALLREAVEHTGHDGEGHPDPDPSTDCKKVYYSGTEPCSCGLDDLYARIAAALKGAA